MGRYVLDAPQAWQRLLIGLYRSYRSGLSSLGRWFPGGEEVPAPSQGGLPEAPGDIQATRLGNQYRGFGILVAMLGVAAAWAELYPLVGRWRETADVARVVLLGAILVLVFWGNGSGLRDRWIEARIRAESERQSQLGAQLGIGAGPCADVLGLCHGVLDDQIAYNQRCCVQYSNILAVTRLLGGIGFLLLLLNATIAVVPGLTVPNQWSGAGQAKFWISAAFPTLAGGIAAANAFLRMGPLRDEHGRMEARLRSLRDALNDVDKSDGEGISTIAGALCLQLTGHDRDWREATRNTRLGIA